MRRLKEPGFLQGATSRDFRVRRARSERTERLFPGFVRFGVLVAILISLASLEFGQNQGSSKMSGSAASTASQKQRQTEQSFAPALVTRGHSLFLQNCAFCHGRDAGGGESGPDLTRSKLVAEDVNGNLIATVVRNGRPGKGMPAFSLSEMQIAALAAFIHAQRAEAETENGGRRGVDVADLETGNVEAGKVFFYGAGKCSTCHSPKGDLAGIASRYQGLQLEERVLYPDEARSKVTVTLPSGQVVTGTLAYHDEFTLGLRDAAGFYHSWPVRDVTYTINSPVKAHVDLLGKYTDTDIHNLMAYLQTLR